GSVNIANPSLKVTKGPDLSVCKGKTGDLTITVENTGNVPVSGITVTDLVPNGWTFDSIVSGAATSASQVANLITFSRTFTLQPCDKITIVFRLKAENSAVAGQDVASAQGAFSTTCTGSAGVGPATATSQLTPKDNPCVTVACDAPDGTSICVGKDYHVRGTATNCSASAEDITVAISGPRGGLGTQMCTAVPPSGPCELIITPCRTVLGTASSQVAVSASSDGGAGVGPATGQLPVTPKEQPCVTVACDAPDGTSLCVGKDYRV